MMKSFLVLCLLSSVSGVQSGVASECKVTKSQLHDAGKTLFIFGDRRLTIPRTDGKDIEEHCSKMRTHLNTASDFAKCQKAFSKQVIGLLLKGYKKELKKQCKSSQWGKDLVRVTHCLNDTGNIEASHECMDRTTAALKYSLTRVPDEHQVLTLCCGLHLFKKCTRDITTKACDASMANFVEKTITGYLGDVVSFLCSSLKDLSKCQTQYPVYTKEFQQIFDDTSKKYPQKNVIEPLLEIVLKHDN